MSNININDSKLYNIKLASLSLLALALCTCARPLDYSEIKNLEREAFEPLYLQPDYEVVELRWDIIRQQDRNVVNDSTSETEAVDYHYLGFDLGNGLFFDLNQNLGFRVLQLLSADRTDFELISSTYPFDKQAERILEMRQDSFCVHYFNFFGKKKTRCRVINQMQDTLKIMNGKRRYTKVENFADSLVWKSKRRPISIIKQESDSLFLVGRKKLNHSFRISEDGINLDDDYLVRLDETKKEIQVYRQRRQRPVLLYRIIKGNNSFYIYNKRYYGFKVQLDDRQLSLFNGKRVVRRMELL